MGAEECGLEDSSVELAELELKSGRARLGSVTNGGQGEAGDSLHRTVGEDDRVPVEFARSQMERGLGDFYWVGEVIGLPGSVSQGYGSGEAVG
jgi:hypothetical protein